MMAGMWQESWTRIASSAGGVVSDGPDIDRIFDVLESSARDEAHAPAVGGEVRERPRDPALVGGGFLKRVAHRDGTQRPLAAVIASSDVTARIFASLSVGVSARSRRSSGYSALSVTAV